MTLKLWHVRHSRSLRPLWLSWEMGLEIEVTTIPNDRTFFASDEWAKVNPAGKVPVLEDGPVRLGESVAIMQYLMGRHGPTDLDVKPADPDFPDYLFWLHYAEAGSAAYVATLLGHVVGVPEYQVSKEHEALLRRQCDRAQAIVADAVRSHPFLLVRGFSAADIAMGYTLHLMRLAKIPFRPEVAEWMTALYARPAFARALDLGKTAKA